MSVKKIDLQAIEVSESGYVAVDVKNSSITVSGTVTANPSASTSGAPTSPSVSTSSVTVLSSNANRKMAIIRSPSTAGTVQCFLRFDGSAAATSHLELNRGESVTITNFTGAITGITASGTVILEVVEFA